MQENMQTSASVSKVRFWFGIIFSVLVVLCMLFDATIHFMEVPVVVQSYQQFGYSLSIIRPLSIIEYIAIILYAIPQTSVLGAILLTGYLGGAVDNNVRAGLGFFGYILSPVYVGVLAWLGLWLRDSKISDIVPFKK